MWESNSFLWTWQLITCPWAPFEHDPSRVWVSMLMRCYINSARLSQRCAHAWNVNSTWSLHITCFILHMVNIAHTCCHNTRTCHSWGTLNRWATSWSKIHLTLISSVPTSPSARFISVKGARTFIAPCEMSSVDSVMPADHWLSCTSLTDHSEWLEQ